MRSGVALVLGALLISVQPLSRLAAAQRSFQLPQTVVAGSAVTIPTSGSGKAIFYLVGPGQTLQREVVLGKALSLPEGTLVHAGRYLAILAYGKTRESASLDVLPAAEAAHLSFLARPSRLPVDIRDGISGAVYVFDAYHNLILAPKKVLFQLSPPTGAAQTSTTQARDGAAWTKMNSTQKQGADTFLVRVDGVSTKQVIDQVPGSPCNLRVQASPFRGRLQLKTDPVRDCSGNPVPDGTIVTFTETYGDFQSIADVPLKHGVAQIELPARKGATITVASGVAMGNQIRWGR